MRFQLHHRTVMCMLNSMFEEKSYKDKKNICRESKKLLDSDDSHKESHQDPILKRLHTIIEHQEDLLQKQNRTEDWHVVAVVIDR